MNGATKRSGVIANYEATIINNLADHIGNMILLFFDFFSSPFCFGQRSLAGDAAHLQMYSEITKIQGQTKMRELIAVDDSKHVK